MESNLAIPTISPTMLDREPITSPLQDFNLIKRVIFFMLAQQGPMGLIAANGVNRFWKAAAKEVAQESQKYLLDLFSRSLRTHLSATRQSIFLLNRFNHLMAGTIKKIMDGDQITSARDVMMEIRRIRGVFAGTSAKSLTSEELRPLQAIELGFNIPTFFKEIFVLARAYQNLFTLKTEHRDLTPQERDFSYRYQIRELLMGLDIRNAIKLTYRVQNIGQRNNLFCRIAETLVEIGNQQKATEVASMITESPLFQDQVLSAIETIFSDELMIEADDLLRALKAFDCLNLDTLVKTFLNSGRIRKAREIADLASVYYDFKQEVMDGLYYEPYHYTVEDQIERTLITFAKFLIRAGKKEEAFNWIRLNPIRIPFDPLLAELLKRNEIDYAITILPEFRSIVRNLNDKRRAKICIALVKAGKMEEAINFAKVATNPYQVLTAILDTLLFNHNDLQAALNLIINEGKSQEGPEIYDFILLCDVTTFLLQTRTPAQAIEYIRQLPGIPSILQDELEDTITDFDLTTLSDYIKNCQINCSLDS